MANILDPVTNFAVATIDAINNSATTANLGAGMGALFPDPATAGAFDVTIFNSTDFRNPSDDTLREIIRITARSTDAVTFSRAQQGTTAQNHNIAGKVYKIVLTPSKGQRDQTETALQNSKLLTAAPATDHTVSGLTVVLTAAQAQAIGDVVFIASTGKASLAKADAIANGIAIFMVADATIAQDATGNYLCLGFIRDDTWNWTVGAFIYLTIIGTTGNTLSQTAPTATDNVVQIVGWATHADRMYFSPQLIPLELS